MNKFEFFFATLIVGAFALTSCNKEPAVPVTRTVLTSIVGSNVDMYDNTLETFKYDENYRIIEVVSKNPFINKYQHELSYTYGDGTIVAEGIEDGVVVYYACTLDAEGRIVTIDRTFEDNGNKTEGHYSYTYDENGHLVSSTNTYDYDDPQGGTTANYTWEGDELKQIESAKGVLITTFEASDAPAEAFFYYYSYEKALSYLCPQGCFGRVPKHLPSKRTVSAHINNIVLYSMTIDFKATVDEKGHLATVEYVDSKFGEENRFVFNWQEK